MSIHVLSWVLIESEARLGARLTLIALAEFAHDDGSKAFPSIETLIERTRMSRSGVKSSLKQLRDDGRIIQTGTTRSGTAIYTVVMHEPAQPPGGSESDRGSESDPGQDLTGGGPNSGPNPSVEPSTPPGVRRDARGGALKISGRPVQPHVWALTQAILGEFNQQAGKNLRLCTSAGEPSEAAKRIYGRVMRYPDISLAEHADIIRRTLASRWWGDGDPTPGVVYGPKVFEDNITRSAGDGQKRSDAKPWSGSIQRMMGGSGAVE